jgi:hypothetical protein
MNAPLVISNSHKYDDELCCGLGNSVGALYIGHLGLAQELLLASEEREKLLG